MITMSPGTKNNQQQKVLLLHSGALGDCILLARFAVAALPQTYITACCGKSKSQLLCKAGNITNAVDIESIGIDFLFSGVFDIDVSTPKHVELINFLKSFDIVISALGFGDEKLTHRLKSICKDVRLINPRPNPVGDKHIFDIWESQSAFQLPASKKFRKWQTPQTYLTQAKTILETKNIYPNEFSLIHPGAGSVKKCFSVDKFAQLADSLNESCVIVCGEVERERFREADFKKLDKSATILCELDLLTLSGIIQLSKRFIGNDSGPAHLSAALGVDTTVIFADDGSSSKLFCPIMPNAQPAKIVQGETMELITVENVLKTLK